MADEQIVTSIVAKADLSSLVSEVHRATASLQQLQRELNTSNRSIASATKISNNLFRDSLVGSGMFSSHFVNLNSDIDKFGKNLDAGRLKLKDYFSTFQTHLKTSKGLIRELAREQVMLQNSVLQPLGRNAQGLMQYNVLLPRGLDEVKNKAQLARMEMQVMNRALSEGSTALINWGKNTQWAGRQLTVGLTVPLSMFGTAAAKAFKEADQELVRLTKVYGGVVAPTAAELKTIRNEVIGVSKELSKAYGSNFKDTISLAADIAATGKQGNDLLNSVKETTRLAVLGEVDRQDAMKATLAIQTAFKQNTTQLADSVNFLNAVENQTSTTLADLIEAIPKAGPVIKGLGGSIKDLALYLTAMKEGGIQAGEAANALKSGLASLINPTKAAQTRFKSFGIDILGIVNKNAGNVTGTILDLQAALDKLNPLQKQQALEQLFGKFQFARMNALFSNLGKQGSQTLQVLELMKASASDLAGIANREMAQVTESASGKFRRAIESLKANLATTGEGFLNVATKFINAFSKLIDMFNNLPGPIKKALTYLGGFTAVIGPIIMLTGVLANFFGYITKGIVSMRAFFQRAHGWKLLTPEIIAAQKASELVEKSFYSDAKAAEVLHGALTKLVSDYMNLQKSMNAGTIPVNPAVTTMAGSNITGALRREVDPTSVYAGETNTRAMSHINPRNPNSPASIFGGVPGAIPVNRGIGRSPQIYMNERLPDIEGLTSIKGISTGIVSGEAARFHALMATLGMQTQAEVAALKKTIALGGTVSSELLATFDDILPMTTKLADNAATESARIVSELKAGKMTVDQAKTEIMAVNAQLESAMQSEIGAYASSRGRTIDFTKAPLMDQPVVDATGQFTLRDLYKKQANRNVMEEFGRLRGIRTFGAPYSIQTTRMPRFNDGGGIESFGPNKTVVSGSTSINYDDRLGSVPLNGYVLNQSASLNPQNAPLAAMAPYTFEDGGKITAALTPGEIVFGPKLHRIPGLYDALEAANSGYNFGGQILRSKNNYGKDITETPAYYRQQLGQLVKFIQNPAYEDSIRMRMVMLDAAELMEYAGMNPEEAISHAYNNFNSAKANSRGSQEEFIKQRIQQVKNLEKKYPGLKHPNKKGTRVANSFGLNKHISLLRKTMMDDPRFANVYNELDKMITFSTDPKKGTSAGVPYLQARDAQGRKIGQVRGHLTRNENVGYATRGFMGVAAVIDAELNSLMARLDQINLRSDVLHLNQADAKESLHGLIQKAGMQKLTTLDDIATALADPGNKFPSKKELEAARLAGISRATTEQKNSLKMLLQAITERKRWVMVPKGRPPIMTPVLASFNQGGSIPGGYISRSRGAYGYNPLYGNSKNAATQLIRGISHAEIRAAQKNWESLPPEQKAKLLARRGIGLPVTSSPVDIGMPMLTPEKMLKVLNTSKELSGKNALGEFAGMSPVLYSHQISPSTGKSYPIPGVSGLYKNENGNLVFFKGVPNAISAKAEMYGTRMAREVFGLDSPNQVIKTIRNPYDPSGKSKLLGLESPFEARFSAGGTQFTEDQMIRQTIASLIMGNKDLSKTNVFGNILADVGPAGVFSRASMNTAYASDMNSMEKQAMINLLAVRGGARKDFAHNTASIAAGMTSRQYGMKIKNAMKDMHPKLLKFIASLPESERAPYLALLSRFEEGMKVNWGKYHAIHSAPKYNTGGGIIRHGRSAYGRPGNPAARAAWEAKQAQKKEIERQIEASKRASHSDFGSKAIYTSQLNPPSQMPAQMGGARIIGGFYNPASAIRAALVDPHAYRINLMAQYANQAAKDFARNVKAAGPIILETSKYTAMQMRAGVMAYASQLKDSAIAVKTMVRGQILRAQDFVRTRIHQPLALEAYQQHREAGTLNTMYRPGMITGPIGLTPWKVQETEKGLFESRKKGYYGFRTNEYKLNGETITREQAVSKGLMERRGAMGQGAQMGIMFAGQAAGGALMAHGQGGLGMGVMMASSILPFMGPQIVSGIMKAKTAALAAASAFKSGAGGVRLMVNALTAIKAAGPLIAIAAIVTAITILINKTRQWNKDAQLRFGMNAKAAEQAGIKYQSLADKIKLVNQHQAALQNVGKGTNGMAFGGTLGLNMSINELQKYRDDAKKNLGEFVGSFNRANAGNIGELATNVKAQFVAAGMSVEEANKKIMGIVAASKNSSLAIKVLTDNAFTGIKDSATAASFSYKHLIDTIKSGSQGTDQYKTKIIEGISSVIDLSDKSLQTISQQKDAAGNLKGEYQGLLEVMQNMKQSGGMDTAIGTDAFRDLPKELQAITSETDSIAGIFSKWRLLLKGVQVDIKGLSSDTAMALDKYLTSFSAAQDQLIEAGKNAFKSGLGFGGLNNTFKEVGYTMARLQGIINTTGREAMLAQQKASNAAQDQNKILQKQIDLIKQAADEKLKALDATQAKENYQIQLQKATMEYQDAVAKGDFQAAERARLNLVQLQQTYQAEQAKLAIQEQANKDAKALQDKQQVIADQEAARQRKLQDAQNNAARAQEAMAKITDFSTRYKDLLLQKQTNEFIQNPADKNTAQTQTNNQLIALVKEIQTAATSKTDIAADIKKAFSEFFDTKGNPLAFDTTKTTAQYSGSGLQVVTSTIKGAMNDVLNKDLNASKAQASLITGGMTISDLARSIAQDIANLKNGTNLGVGTITGNTIKDLTKSGAVNIVNDAKLAGIRKETETMTVNGRTYSIFKYNGKTYASDQELGTIYAYDESKKAINYDKIVAPGRLASGGRLVGPGTGTSDSIPAMLSNGEYVINAASAAKFGYDNLDAVNKMAAGGPVFRIPKMSTGGRLNYAGAGPVMGNVTIDFVINAAPGMDEALIANMAAQKVFEVVSNRKLQMGQGKLSQLNRMAI